jgi:DNA repair protein RadC
MTLDVSPDPTLVARPRSDREPLAPFPSGREARPQARRTAAPRRRRDITTRYRLALVREEIAPYGALDTPPEEDPRVTRPAEAARFLWTRIFHDEPREVVAVVFLNTRNRATGHMIAFTGTLERTTAEPRHILAAALLANASGILVAHNHPSGDPTPSTEDLLFTRRMESACEILGIRLVDSMVFGSARRWTSVLRKAVW